MRPIFSLFLLLLLSLVTLPAKSHAEEYVLCLQRQLNALGYDAGPEDGLWGKRTKAAALALRSENPKLTDNPYLETANRASAISWCREVGSTDFRARRHRPSIKEPEYRFSEGVTTVQGAIIQSSAQRAWKFLKARFKIEMASRIDVAAGVDAGKIARDIKALSRPGSTSYYPSQRSYVRKKCTEITHWSAAAYPDFIMLCAAPDMSSDKQWLDKRRKLTGLLVHEFVHSFQAEHSLSKTQPDLWRRGEKTMGPPWLVEAAAMMAEAEFISLGLEDFGLYYFVEWQFPARVSKLKLGKMRQIETNEEYEVARFAGLLLAKRESVNRMLDYWRLLGQGRSKNEAFGEVFGMSFKEFEAHFEKARKDVQYALKFARGEI